MKQLPTLYFVKPTELLTSMDFSSEDLHKFATAERVWSNDESGVLDFTFVEQTDIVKVVVLAYFLSFGDLDDALGKPMLTVENFDRFWAIRRFSTDGKLSHLSDYSQRLEVSRFQSLGNVRADKIAKRFIGWIEDASA